MINFTWLFLTIGVLVGVFMRAIQARRVVPDAQLYRRELMPYFFRLGATLVVPWIAMGVLLLSGVVRDAELFAQKSPTNVWVTCWRWLFFADTLILVLWVAVGPGAKLFERYPFLLNLPRANVVAVRIGAVIVWIFFWAILVANL